MCRSEAPLVEQFARDQSDRLRVVGIGAQDDLSLARDFVSTTGVTFTMLWSESSEAWRQFAIRSNSEFWLIDKDGNRIDNSATLYDESHIEHHLASLSRS